MPCQQGAILENGLVDTPHITMFLCRCSCIISIHVVHGHSSLHWHTCMSACTRCCKSVNSVVAALIVLFCSLSRTTWGHCTGKPLTTSCQRLYGCNMHYHVMTTDRMEVHQRYVLHGHDTMVINRATISGRGQFKLCHAVMH